MYKASFPAFVISVESVFGLVNGIMQVKGSSIKQPLASRELCSQDPLL